jgi:hypothetical protein
MSRRAVDDHNIFRLQIAMHNLRTAEQDKRMEEIAGHALNEVDREAFELETLEEREKIGAEELEDDAEMAFVGERAEHAREAVAVGFCAMRFQMRENIRFVLGLLADLRVGPRNLHRKHGLGSLRGRDLDDAEDLAEFPVAQSGDNLVAGAAG